MRVLLILSSLLLLLSGCRGIPIPDILATSHKPDWIYDQRMREEFPTDDVTWIVEKYIVSWRHEHDLYLENSMICISDDQTVGPTLRLEFVSQTLLADVCEGREFLVDFVEGLIFEMNNNYVDPFLRPAPFTSANLEIYIKFESFYGEFVDPFYMGWIVLEENMAYYYAFTLDNTKLNSWDLHEEPYFKSRSIAFAQKQAEKEYRLLHPKKSRAPTFSLEGNAPGHRPVPVTIH